MIAELVEPLLRSVALGTQVEELAATATLASPATDAAEAAKHPLVELLVVFAVQVDELGAEQASKSIADQPQD